MLDKCIADSSDARVSRHGARFLRHAAAVLTAQKDRAADPFTTQAQAAP